MFHIIKALRLLTVVICFIESTTIPIVKELLGTKHCVWLINNLKTIMFGCILFNLDLC